MTQLLGIACALCVAGWPAAAHAPDVWPKLSVPGQTVPFARALRLAQLNGARKFSLSDSDAPAGAAVALSISMPRENFSDYALIMVRGMPAGFTLSAGVPLNDAWAISVRDAAGLTLVPPAGFKGRVSVEAMLVRERGATPERASAEIRFGLAEIAPAAAAAISAPKTSVSPAVEAALLKRADALLKNSDVAGARLVFEHLANQGSARGAFLMGQSYDPSFFRTIHSSGLKPDAVKAREWYRTAAELGEGEAVSRISALDGR